MLLKQNGKPYKMRGLCIVRVGKPRGMSHSLSTDKREIRSVRKPIVIANWKMNGSLEANRLWAEKFLQLKDSLQCSAAVCAPFVYLSQMVDSLRDSGIAVGGQTVSVSPAGAFTGEVSAGMLRDIGATLCLIGHSERRTLWGETDEAVAAQAQALVRAGVVPVLCVGETLEERSAGATETVVLRQLRAVLAKVPVSALGAVAYEPVWAIGTGHTATPETAQAVHAALRAALREADPAAAEKLPLLYGGSVKPANAHELFNQPDIDGGLIGGAALKAEDFYAVCAACPAD